MIDDDFNLYVSSHSSMIDERTELTEAKETLESGRASLLSTLKDLEKEVEFLRQDNDRMTSDTRELDKLRKELAELTADPATAGPPSWETDEELKDMAPSDILEIVGDDLNLRERALLNEMVVKELQGEMEKKSDDLLKKMIEANKKQQELDRLNMRIKCLEAGGNNTSSSSVDPKEDEAKTQQADKKSALGKRATRYGINIKCVH